jgi:hypothetical protein
MQEVMEVKCTTPFNASAYDPLGLLGKAEKLPEADYVLGRPIAEKQAGGLTIIDANDYVLQLDFDTTDAYETFVAILLPGLLRLDHDKGILGIRKVVKTMLKSGNTHVYITTEQVMLTATRVALQAILGSDPVREMLNIAGYLTGIPNGIMLFENPHVQPEVIYDANPTRASLTQQLQG